MTEWTVCPCCEAQVAIDDYQEDASMCNECRLFHDYDDEGKPKMPEPTFTDDHLIVNGERVAWKSFWSQLEREYRKVCDELDRDSLAEHVTQINHLISAVTSGSWDRLDTVDNARLGEASSRLALLAKGLKVAQPSQIC